MDNRAPAGALYVTSLNLPRGPIKAYLQMKYPYLQMKTLRLSVVEYFVQGCPAGRCGPGIQIPMGLTADLFPLYVVAQNNINLPEIPPPWLSVSSEPASGGSWWSLCNHSCYVSSINVNIWEKVAIIFAYAFPRMTLPLRKGAWVFELGFAKTLHGLQPCTPTPNRLPHAHR